MAQFRNVALTLSVIFLAACGGDDESVAAAVSSTSASPTTTEASTTTTESTTTVAPTTTTTTEPAAAELTPEELADAMVLPSGFFGDDWSEEPQEDSDFAYTALDGCDFLDGLNDEDGNLAEAESPVFSQFDTEVEHDVRVYTSVGHATDVVIAWAEPDTIECLSEGEILQAQTALDDGELAPFTEFAFEINVFDDHVGEPRLTNIEIANTLTGPDGEVLVYVDIYFVQVGRSVTRLEVVNPDAVWGQTDELLEKIAERMTSVDPAAA